MLQFFIKYILPVAVVGLIVFMINHVRTTQPKEVKTLPPITPSRTEYASTVAGSGIIEAQHENIAIGTPVPGIVTDVFVEVGQAVVKGDKLFKIEDRSLVAELEVQKKNLAAMEADLARLQKLPRNEQIPVTQAVVAEAKAVLEDRIDDQKRTERLLPSRAVSEQDVITARQATLVAQAQLAKAQAELTRQMADVVTWDYEIQGAQALVAKAAAQVKQIETQIARTEVLALADGQVLQVNVRPGEYAAAPSSEPLIILGNIAKLHVRVDIDEHDIPRVPKFIKGDPGNPAAFARLKGETLEKYPLTFVRAEPYVVPKKSLTGLNTERVDTRVLQLIFEVDREGRELYVGQQVDVFIDAGKNTPSKPAPMNPATTASVPMAQ
jgi:multidrug efflux pump subunit AcrA (membrane-fusion protein)